MVGTPPERSWHHHGHIPGILRALCHFRPDVPDQLPGGVLALGSVGGFVAAGVALQVDPANHEQPA
jgi:hypothetical protein